ncbi:MAG: CYTH domain-containing protein [Lachnospiraceae bacterium]|nr:CYTH domain-containing protein [Lachnospiraceae bacterium]
MEIERKFLVTKLPDNLAEYPHAELSQGYLASKGTTVRIRRADDRYYLTIKKKPDASQDSKDALVNIEIEEEIPAELFERLSKYVETPLLRKTRYRIPHLSYVAELDLYHGVLEGLATAEIEFPNLSEAKLSDLPEWFGREVTGDRRYRNSELAKLTTLDGLPLE